ncbi:hypothetical protein, partial [Actinomadura roseirufa]|uniref:hypothetical protein n=1 Tax=Actinomadura roseirufa TaxID=2094049 RepID=UPI00104199A9
MKTRIAMYAAGLALMAWGVRGVVLNVNVAGWALWFAGAAVTHDGVLVPLVLVAGLLIGVVPVAYRPIVRAALICAGCTALYALPLVLGYGRRADTPSQLPLPYGRNLGIVVGAIAAAAVLAALARLLTDRRGGRAGAARRPEPSG